MRWRFVLVQQNDEVSEYWGWERGEERHGDLLEIRQQDEWIFGIIEDQREG